VPLHPEGEEHRGGRSDVISAIRSSLGVPGPKSDSSAIHEPKRGESATHQFQVVRQ
jgi:hypothetical protein